MAVMMVACGGKSAPAPLPIESGNAVRATSPVPTGAFITYNPKNRLFIMGNRHVSRMLQLQEQGRGVVTASLAAHDSGLELLDAVQNEFRVRAAGRDWIGYGGDLKVTGHRTETDASGAQQLRVTLESPAPKGNEPQVALRVVAVYEIHKTEPLMRKWLEVTNIGNVPFLLEEVETERLSLRTVDQAFRWTRGNQLSTASLPLNGGGDDGLLWLRLAGEGGTAHLVGVMNESPGASRQTFVSPTGILAAGVASSSLGKWLQPEETSYLPSVYLWVDASADALAANDTWLALMATARRRNHLLGEPSRVVVMDMDAINAESLRGLPSGALVCVRYSWQEAWDDPNASPDALNLKGETVRASGRRFGIVAPIAWLPEGGSLAKTETNSPTLVKRATVPSVWHGKSGILAPLDSDYALLAGRTLTAICDTLNLDGLVLEGDLFPPNIPGDLETYNRFLSLLDRIKRERPQTVIGIGASSVQMTDGFDAAFASVAFLGSATGSAATDTNPGYWRKIEWMIAVGGNGEGVQ
ncbi:MAG: hypothetical protein O3A46_01600 [Candidatus Poribacteria bacterium]|nr:hypothetical protein [Candidatus Poribacteria bacterium]